jgi:transposase
MGSDRAAPTEKKAESQRRPPGCRRPQLFRRNSLDLTNRSSMERPTRCVSESRDVLAAVVEMGKRRSVAGSLASVSGPARRAGPTRLERGIHGRFVHGGQKGGSCIGKTRKGKGTKCMVLVDGQGIPLGMHLSSASRAEAHLAEETLSKVAVPRAGPGRPRQRPDRIIADKGYDSQDLWKRMKARGIDFIVPHKSNRKNPYQDGRKLRRFSRRWIVERTFAWLFNFRRLFVRYEHETRLFHAFFCLACALVVMRRF